MLGFYICRWGIIYMTSFYTPSVRVTPIIVSLFSKGFYRSIETPINTI